MSTWNRKESIMFNSINQQFPKIIKAKKKSKS
jgi:hypothetical protein